jgi:predicted DNA binding CopG/RHH family protein
LVLDTGGKDRKSMKNKIKYTDGPIGEVRVVKDFLPPPSELAYREDTVKVTLQLSRASVDYFKKEAQIHDTPYQRMIRRLLDEYAEHHVH